MGFLSQHVAQWSHQLGGRSFVTGGIAWERGQCMKGVIYGRELVIKGVIQTSDYCTDT